MLDVLRGEKKNNRIATVFAFGIPQLLLPPFEVMKSQQQLDGKKKAAVK